jgi:hypothetical protein
MLNYWCIISQMIKLKYMTVYTHIPKTVKNAKKNFQTCSDYKFKAEMNAHMTLDVPQTDTCNICNYFLCIFQSFYLRKLSKLWYQKAAKKILGFLAKTGRKFASYSNPFILTTDNSKVLFNSYISIFILPSLLCSYFI